KVATTRSRGTTSAACCTSRMSVVTAFSDGLSDAGAAIAAGARQTRNRAGKKNFRLFIITHSPSGAGQISLCSEGGNGAPYLPRADLAACVRRDDKRRTAM